MRSECLTTIADSSAYRDRKRVLPQHQAALTLLQARLSTPGTSRLCWLDLACGRGQIIVFLDENFSAEARAKIEYSAYDINEASVREMRKTAALLNFARLQTKVGDLSDFDQTLPQGVLFDFITLTNTVHEINPLRLANLLACSIGRLTDTGTLYIYDMERIKPPELGALPWSRNDIQQIVLCLLGALGAAVYRPEVSLWSHSTCNGWNVQLQRQHLNVSRADAEARVSTAIQKTAIKIKTLLERRFAECRMSLETLTLCGAETPEEQEAKERLLFEFWALYRALEPSL